MGRFVVPLSCLCSAIIAFHLSCLCSAIIAFQPCYPGTRVASPQPPGTTSSDRLMSGSMQGQRGGRREARGGPGGVCASPRRLVCQVERVPAPAQFPPARSAVRPEVDPLAGSRENYYCRSQTRPPRLGKLYELVAKRLGVTQQALSALLNGRAGVSASMALRLEGALGTSAEMWLNMQTSHDLWRARKRPPRVQRQKASKRAA